MAGKLVGKSTHVTGPLNVVLTPQWRQTAARFADIACQQGQVDEGGDVVSPVGVLG